MNQLQFALLALLVCSCSKQNGSQSIDGTLNKEDRAQFIALAAGIRASDKVLLFEGVPHRGPGLEFKSELDGKRIFDIDGFAFYSSPLKLDPADAQSLKAICFSEDSHDKVYGATKACMGFHPDYCLRWRGKTNTYDVSICFGCREWRFTGPTNKLSSDISDAAFGKLKPILVKYIVNRPRSSTWPPPEFKPPEPAR